MHSKVTSQWVRPKEMLLELCTSKYEVHTSGNIKKKGCDQNVLGHHPISQHFSFSINEGEISIESSHLVFSWKHWRLWVMGIRSNLNMSSKRAEKICLQQQMHAVNYHSHIKISSQIWQMATQALWKKFISTEGALRLPTTYDNHPIHPIHTSQ